MSAKAETQVFHAMFRSDHRFHALSAAGELMQRARYDQFLASEARTLVRDAHGNVLDEASQMPPHLLLQQCVRLGV